MLSLGFNGHDQSADRAGWRSSFITSTKVYYTRQKARHFAFLWFDELLTSNREFKGLTKQCPNQELLSFQLWR